MAEYEVKKGLMGHKVLYACPACGVPLTSPLAQAGTTDACPDCNQTHVIPGSVEKAEFERSAASAQRQKLEEATKRKAALRKPPSPTIQKPIAQPIFDTGTSDSFIRPAEPSSTKPISRPSKSVRRRNFGDSILDAAFAIARGFSVVVIILCLVALVAIGAFFVLSFTDYRPVQAATTRVPTTEDYNAYVASRRESATASDNSEAASLTNELTPASALIKKYNLTLTGFQGEVFATLLERLHIKLNSAEFDVFLKHLDNFLAAQRNKIEAAIWFASEYSDNYDVQQDQSQDDELHNARVSAKLWLLATTAAAVFGRLISFMVLPLLIRIEANTRYTA